MTRFRNYAEGDFAARLNQGLLQLSEERPDRPVVSAWRTLTQAAGYDTLDAVWRIRFIHSTDPQSPFGAVQEWLGAWLTEHKASFPSFDTRQTAVRCGLATASCPATANLAFLAPLHRSPHSSSQ